MDIILKNVKLSSIVSIEDKSGVVKKDPNEQEQHLIKTQLNTLFNTIYQKEPEQFTARDVENLCELLCIYKDDNSLWVIGFDDIVVK